MKPSKHGAQFEAKNYFDADHSKELADSLNRLRFPSEGRPFSEEQRSTGTWKVLFSDFLRDFQAWSPSGTEIDILHQRLTVLRWLIELTPPGEDRIRVLRLCVDGSAVRRSGPPEPCRMVLAGQVDSQRGWRGPACCRGGLPGVRRGRTTGPLQD